MAQLSGNNFIPEATPLVVLAEGCFGTQQAKTATGVIQYGNWPITAVLDSEKAGQRVCDVTPLKSTAPIVSSLQDALALQPAPKALLIGTAPPGGGLPDTYRQIVREAIENGLHIISGLHIFLNAQPDLVALAGEKGVQLWDVREAPETNVITRQLPRPTGTKVVTMVGSDCSIGKMFTALEINRALREAGEKSEFVATGQTGIMISGKGIPLDRIIGDFMAGHLEQAIDDVIRTDNPDWVIVEGQGSLLHPAYSGVTMALIHGSAPDAMVLCHNPRLTSIRNFDAVLLPPLSKLVEIYQSAAGWIKPAKVVGISLNTSSYSEAEAETLIQATQAETGLPVTDPVRYGVASLTGALKTAFRL